MQSFRNRCKIVDDGGLTSLCLDLLPKLHTKIVSLPASMDNVDMARTFLEHFFVESIDHNASHIGVFCARIWLGGLHVKL